MYYLTSNSKTIRIIFIILSGVLSFGLSGCQQNLTEEPTPEISAGALTPYLTGTASVTPDLSITETPASPTQIPTPSPTPFIYTVVADDTLTGIAFQHSVSLEDLIAANPGIDPNFLTIGVTLTIPLEGVIVAALPTPTPIPIQIEPPVCYPVTDGRLQCMAVVNNDQAFAVENVIAQITLQSGNDQTPVTNIAISPLNLIPAGEKAALSAVFEPPIPPDFTPTVSLLTVIPVSDDDGRYLDSDLQIRAIEIDQDGKQALVSGSVLLLPEQSDASVVWVAAFAYDAQNKIIGIRKWVADQGLVAGSQMEFAFVVYSLDPLIDRVEVLIEARPDSAQGVP
jgi:LysM repeat protein